VLPRGDFVHDMEGITKAGQKGNQKISSHDLQGQLRTKMHEVCGTEA
jgi:hypothetical protein